MGDITSNSWSLVGGTFWIGSVIWDQPLIDPQFRPRCLCHTIPNQWMLEGLGFLIGQQARWLRDGFCQEEVRTAKQQGRDPYNLMEKLAEQVPPGSNGVMGFFSDFHNSKSWRHPSPSFLNFNIYDPQHSGKAECIRALWESAVYVSYKNLLVLKELTGTRPEQVTFCGGSSKGFLWPQILADVFGIPVKTPLVKESTALGCAMCVGVGTGEFNNFYDAVERWVKTDKIFQPDVKVHEKYLTFYERWQDILDDLLKIVDKGLLMPMWKAPGV